MNRDLSETVRRENAKFYQIGCGRLVPDRGTAAAGFASGQRLG
jgi:hypothetical protein